MKLAALVPAGGYGRGAQGNQRKACLPLDGKPLVAHVLARLSLCPRVDAIFLVVPPEDVSYFREEVLAPWSFPRLQGIIPGGMLRQDSIKKALDVMGPGWDYILIHDGNRPLVSMDVLNRTISAAEIHGAAVAAVPERSTIKGITRTNFVALSYDRRRLRCTQTPQVYRYDILSRAYTRAARENYYGPDDSVLVERLEEKIKVVAGSRLNIQVSNREDLLLARALLSIQGELATLPEEESEVPQE